MRGMWLTACSRKSISAGAPVSARRIRAAELRAQARAQGCDPRRRGASRTWRTPRWPKRSTAAGVSGFARADAAAGGARGRWDQSARGKNPRGSGARRL